MSVADFAADLQRIHRESFEGLPGMKWRIMANGRSSTANSVVMTLDMYDSEQTYCILHKVIARPDSAVMLSMHDYACRDYSASAAFFAPIAASLRVASH
jgi:hypothetical protein